MSGARRAAGWRRAAGLVVLLAAGRALGAQAAEDPGALFEDPLVPAEAPAAEAPAAQSPAAGAGAAGGGIVQEGAPPAVDAPEADLLTSRQVEWGGRFEGRFTTGWDWDGYPDGWSGLEAAGEAALASRLEADLFADARPARDFRVFGKLKTRYVYDLARDRMTWSANFFELFSDFSWEERLFFRVGKQTIHWGVGYFFSPADLLNLVSIDPLDPTAEREGPVALKAQLPFGAHNAYLYLVSQDAGLLRQIGVAPKLEFLAGSCELGVGGLFREHVPASLMFTLTGPLGQADLLAEAVLQQDLDRAYKPVLAAATVGAIRQRQIGRHSESRLVLAGQYLLDDVVLGGADRAAAARAKWPGHRLAFSAAWSRILGSRFEATAVWLADLTDASGLVQPTFSWSPIDEVSLGLRLDLPYGEAGDRYAPLGLLPAVALEAKLGVGRF